MAGIRRGRSSRVEEELLQLEQQLTDPATRKSAGTVGRLLHTDFVEYGSSGRVYDKETMLAMMAGESPAPVMISDFAVRLLADDAALVTYRTLGRDGDQARRSSIWVVEDGEWRILFHQGTRIPSHLSFG